MITIQSRKVPVSIGPYSQAMIAGGLIFTSGQIALDADTGLLVGTNLAEQTEQVIANLQAVLETVGSSLTKVVKTTCFLSDMADFDAFNEIYARHFTGLPARSCIEAPLPKGALVEIEAIAEL